MASNSGGRSASALKYLVATITQGSADAFAQSTLITGLSGVGDVAYRIREILIGWPPLPNTNGATLEFAITRKSFAAIPTVVERSLITLFRRYVAFTTSGGSFQPLTERIKFDSDDDLLIVEDPIYIQVDSASTSASNAFTCRIGYQTVRISELDRLTLVSQTLAS